MSPPADANPSAPVLTPPPSGRYVNIPPRSVLTIALYLVLAALLLAFSGNLSSPSVTAALALLILFFLVRYLSTRYILEDDSLYARRLFGSRRVRLDDVRQLELTSLRDLGPVGLFGTWGWRGRVWSPIVGHFDTIHTASPGLLVSAGKFPLFISPRDPAGFARELSRRARSFGVTLDVDAPLLQARASVR